MDPPLHIREDYGKIREITKEYPVKSCPKSRFIPCALICADNPPFKSDIFPEGFIESSGKVFFVSIFGF